MSTDNKSKSNRLKFWIGFAVAFVLFYLLGQFGGKALVNLFKSENTAEGLLTKAWVNTSYGDYGLRVETPAKMIEGDLPIPSNIRQLIDQMDIYNYTSERGFSVLINSIKYKPVIGQVDLQGAANGSINEMRMIQGVKNLEYTEDVFFKNEVPGFIQNGNYNQNGVDAAFINTGLAKDLIFWQVLVVYQKGDKVGQKAAKRVIESITIDEMD